MRDDPIVAEVRAIREQLAAQCDFDIRRIVEESRQRQARSKSQIVSYQRNHGSAEQGNMDRKTAAAADS